MRLPGSAAIPAAGRSSAPRRLGRAEELLERSVKVGLRDYLFIGHPKAGWRSAVIYSVIGTCRLSGVNPEAYIRWVLPKLAAATNRTATTGLLPHDFAQLPQHEITASTLSAMSR
jgi:hypothetical protein